MALRQVLVIDDDPLICTVIAAQLKGLGVEAVTVSSGDADTVRLLKQDGPYDLIISDLAMPGFDGLQLTRIIAASQPAAAVLYISSAGEKLLTAVKTLAVGQGLRVLGSLEKPISRDALRRLLEKFSRP